MEAKKVNVPYPWCANSFLLKASLSALTLFILAHRNNRLADPSHVGSGLRRAGHLRPACKVYGLARVSVIVSLCALSMFTSHKPITYYPHAGIGII